MQDKDTTQSTFMQAFQPFFSKDLWETIHREVPGLDLRSQKLTTNQLTLLISHAQLQEYRALRKISTSVHHDSLGQAIGLESISHSQISRRLKTLPTQVPEMLFKGTLHNVAQKQGYGKIRQQLGKLYMIDASTMSLCLSRYPWAVFRKSKAGVKMHLRLSFDAMAVPDEVLVTPAKTADRKKLDELIVQDQEALNIFDRGYVDYKLFDDYCEKGIRFVTRLKNNAVIEFTGVERPVKEDGLIEEDVDVILGAGSRKMKHTLREVTIDDNVHEPFTILTNDFNLSAEELGEIYRYRWQIELFFKWLKQHAQIKHFYGTSETAVINQILLALMMYCLLVLLKLEAGYPRDLLTLQRLLIACLFERYEEFLEKLRRRRRKGSKRIRYEEIYRMTEHSILKEEETQWLDDLTYDPVIL
ncbi:IS4 family transposase [Desulfitobacterium sp. LBE]|uniref:Transposase IS4-like domain-containing protein n=8 Tax=root TaxID=1 RepID=Q24WX5_DESHY|nr:MULTISPECIES: IS4-like element ISDha3 family transposase [Desulfitobacterium]ACL19992.1 transposase IS4 family protein [Desulfitobacterium hafniense DCB-2]ACL21425.1 transposase IS4 family protein [Desulfitobacterium hafniense DCB-2]MEA5022988.1 IS4-like element ISDha3 family transposase [Desulfitobacterium hafniense]TWH56326.1 IS4 family transposase [Desulfitobacterium sp. LBE]CDV96371.1 Transposase IS4 protein [Desulfitobacterium hafniense]